MSRILVIDDDHDICRLIKDALSRNGYEVTVANDGHEGLSKFYAGRFDTVLTDLVMPGKEGIETIRELRHRAPDLRILAMSGDTATGGGYLRMAQALGANATLAKPFAMQSLLDAIAA
jgi:DNA-binding response OmpR family regulator